MCYESKTMGTCGINSLDFSKSGRLLFVAYDDSLRVWDVLKGDLLYTLEEGSHMQRVTCVQVAPDGRAVCSGSWQDNNRQSLKVFVFIIIEKFVTCVAF